MRPENLAADRPRFRPYRISVPEERLTDLASRLRNVRWPMTPEAPPWHFGTDSGFLRVLVDHWRSAYDWRTWENHLNRYGSSMARIAGLDVHFLIERGSGDSPFPIILTHGWPGSIAEFLEMIDLLAHPEKHGGEASDGFTVIVPSIPGFGFSQAPKAPLTPREVAGLWTELMAGLGFDRYGAHGGDLGGCITGWLGHDDPSVCAIHMNMQVLFPDPGDLEIDPPGEEEAAWMRIGAESMVRERGYQAIQGTKPQTLAYALDDSPVGLAAWLLEKFKAWSNPRDVAPPPFSLDQLITNTMLYWFGQGAAPPSWYYVALHERRGFWMEPGTKVMTPAGFCFFANDLLPSRPPIGHSARVFANIVHRVEHEHGGHFPAMECPTVLADDIRSFFRPYR